MNYVGITVIKDEEVLLPGFLNCLMDIRPIPLIWYIVDDGSVDRSNSIAQEFSTKISWCRLIKMPYRQKRKRGKAVVDAMNKALQFASHLDFKYLIKIDVDIYFNPNVIKILIDRLENDSQIGICGPELFRKINKTFIIDRNLPLDFVRGAFRIYNYQCLLEQKGWISAKGWDGLDQIKAKINGWKVCRYNDIIVYNQRPEGNASGIIASSIENGRGFHFIGGHWLYLIIEASEYARFPPYIIRGVLMISGYIWGALLRDKIADRSIIKFVRKQHKQLINNKIRKIINVNS